jgi:hypothetical protein
VTIVHKITIAPTANSNNGIDDVAWGTVNCPSRPTMPVPSADRKVVANPQAANQAIKRIRRPSAKARLTRNDSPTSSRSNSTSGRTNSHPENRCNSTTVKVLKITTPQPTAHQKTGGFSDR